MTWAGYARSYDRLLLNCDSYLQLQRQVVDLLRGTRFCVDIGAGTGNGVMQFLDSCPESTVWAVDTDPAMLRILRLKLERRPDSHRVTVVENDILNMIDLPSLTFDGAMMTNVLYSVSDPARCLVEAARVLCPGGRLVVSTSWRETKVMALMNTLKSELQSKHLFGQLREEWEAATNFNLNMNHLITRDSLADIREYVNGAGLSIDTWVTGAYAGSTVVFRATKS